MAPAKNKQQTTAMARKTAPLANPANGKEKGKQTVTGNQKQTMAMAANMAPANAHLVKNELLILATAAAMYRAKIPVANQSAILHCSSYCDGSCKKQKTNNSDSEKNNSSSESCKWKGKGETNRDKKPEANDGDGSQHGSSKHSSL